MIHDFVASVQMRFKVFFSNYTHTFPKNNFIGRELNVFYFNVNCVILKTSYTPVPSMAMNHFIFIQLFLISISLFFAQSIFDDGNSCLVFQFSKSRNFDIRSDRQSSVYKKGRSMQMCDSYFILLYLICTVHTFAQFENGIKCVAYTILCGDGIWLDAKFECEHGCALYTHVFFMLFAYNIYSADTGQLTLSI